MPCLRHRAPDADRDPAAGQVHRVQLLDDRQHEDARAHDDLLARTSRSETDAGRVWSTCRPLRPVTMKAWLGPATLIRDRTSSTSRRTRTAMPPMA